MMTWEYLAGFTDGDGCVSIEFSKQRYCYARIRWHQKESDSYVLDCIGDFLRSQGIKLTDRNYSVSRAGHTYPQRELCITNVGDTLTVLRQIAPHLIVKRERVELILPLLEFVAARKALHGAKYRHYMTADELSELARGIEMVKR